MRLDWTFIAKLVVSYVIAVAVGAAIWSRSMSSIEQVSADPEFDSAALDIADPIVRSEVLEHDRWMRTSKLASVADECDRGIEIYRVYLEPGVVSGRLSNVEVRVSGTAASVVAFAAGHGAQPASGAGFEWHPIFESTIEATQLAPIRGALTATLKANVPPAIGDRFVDAPRAVIEACRHNRYHFFSRAFSEDSKEKSDFADLARSILRLAAPRPRKSS